MLIPKETVERTQREGKIPFGPAHVSVRNKQVGYGRSRRRAWRIEGQGLETIDRSSLRDALDIARSTGRNVHLIEEDGSITATIEKDSVK